MEISRDGAGGGDNQGRQIPVYEGNYGKTQYNHIVRTDPDTSVADARIRTESPCAGAVEFVQKQ
jgi:hypothetical protein